MIIEKDLLALSDVANLCGTSSSNISNWRKRDPSFPDSFIETSAGPIWKAEDIVDYLQKKFDDEYDAIFSGKTVIKRMAVVGRARGGKSFYNSRFVKDRLGFVELFCGNSDDKTSCPINVKISEYYFYESYEFHTDFNSIYTADDKDIEITQLREKVSSLVNKSYGQDNIEVMLEIEAVCKAIQAVERRSKKRKCNTYIDTYQRPSEFCKEILRTCGLRSLEIVDTPGVSGNVEASKIAKSDIYVFLLKPDNDDESQTLKRIVTEIKADVATSKAIFLYKKEGVFLTKRKYEDARLKIRKDMAAYNDLFTDLKGNIISTDLEVLDPSSHSILFPTMDSDEVILSEELFLEEIREKLLEAFKPEDEISKDEEFKKIVSDQGDQAVELALNILRNIPIHVINTENIEYTTEQLLSENHDRVMTKDNYRLRIDLDNAYSEEANILDSYFSSYTAEDYPEGWKQVIIKYIHKKLTESIRTDRGLGVGTHHWEERPARTMLVEESILADRVLASILDTDEKSRNRPYRRAFIDSNISSATWNYVGCVNDEDAITKLKIIKECLLHVSVSKRKEMVLTRYVGGLRKLAEYKILRNLGYKEDKCMDELKLLPF
ncbi:hypothetical protein [Paenibacillus hubeiensis]|uniref:hypothetical protein n=1 Tax=Paenibacillus hubeiensis TaxID=3077330 RepID=UPI0031BBC729